MKTYLPHYFKKIGIALVIIAFIVSAIANINNIRNGYAAGYNSAKVNIDKSQNIKLTESALISTELENTLTWISLSLSFSGFLLYIFSKEKIEDEFIQKLRYNSLGRSLLYTWIIATILFIINGAVKLEGFYILQFQLILYVLIYNYYKKWKFI
jgi:hypothetical protein